MSLRARLVVLALLATLLPAMLAGWRFFDESEAEIRAAERALAAAAESLADDLGQRVRGSAQLLYGLAHARDLDTPDRAACSAFLSRVRETYAQYTGILTVRPDGRLFCDSLRTGRELNLSDRGYFKRAREGRETLILEPAFGRLTGLSVLQVVHPVRDAQGALRFMLVASLNLQRLAQDSPRAGLPSPPELLLVDRQGQVMLWSGQSGSAHKPGSSIADSAWLRLARTLPQGGIGEIAGDDGRPQVWAVAAAPAVRNAGLHLMLGLDKQALVAAARLRLRQDLLLLGGVALLLFGGVWLLATWGIRRPFERITGMVRRLGQGDLGARIAPPYPRGEVGSLMAALNSTAASLERQRAAIDELGLKLRQAQKLEAIGTLAGGIAHDFNNILGAILGNLSLAQEDAAAGRASPESLEQIRRAALRARDLVQRIQAFSRQDAPALLPQPLRPIVEEVLALVQVALPAGAALRVELGDEPLAVMADASQLHQVLMNLCANAWQALDGQPGTLTVGLDAVELSAAELATDGDPARPAGLQPGRHAHLWVRDTGSGIADGHRERIFEPFFTTKSGRGGTGLGLSVVHGIVGAHHGSIVVDSVPGQGSCFHVYLPLLADAAAGSAPAAVAEAPPPLGRGERVLYLDDDEVMGLMVERLLVRAGYRVTSHHSAHDALAAVAAAPAAYDLVLTDFNMPDLSGLDVSRRLAALRPDLPVLIISGHIFDELPAQARRAGVRGLIRKQHVLEELVPAVARALASRRD